VQAELKDENAVKIIKEGIVEKDKKKMDPYKDKFTDEEIKALIGYIGVQEAGRSSARNTAARRKPKSDRQVAMSGSLKDQPGSEKVRAADGKVRPWASSRCDKTRGRGRPPFSPARGQSTYGNGTDRSN